MEPSAGSNAIPLVPDSPDTNGRLTKIQVDLITDPAKNMLASLQDVEQKSYRFLSWWDKNSGAVYRIRDGIVRRSETVLAGEVKKIDSRKVAGHSLSPTAGSYWFYDSDGYIRAYEDQLGDTDLGGWGIMLPQGDPADLGVTLDQHNAVLAQRAAFAQRRLATLRTPALVQALVETYPGKLDSGASEAIQYARNAPGTLPYPGASGRKPKTLIFKPKPKALIFKAGRLPPPGGTGGVLVLGGVAAAAYLFLAVK